MGVVHHANYLHWMEEARIHLMDQLGFPYAVMEEKGVLSPVKSVSCEYRHSCTFGDDISITVSVSAFNGVVMTLQYEMRNQHSEVICTATSDHVFLTREGHFARLKRDMPEFCAAITALMTPEQSS